MMREDSLTAAHLFPVNAPDPPPSLLDHIHTDERDVYVRGGTNIGPEHIFRLTDACNSLGFRLTVYDRLYTQISPLPATKGRAAVRLANADLVRAEITRNRLECLLLLASLCLRLGSPMIAAGHCVRLFRLPEIASLEAPVFAFLEALSWSTAASLPYRMAIAIIEEIPSSLKSSPRLSALAALVKAEQCRQQGRYPEAIQVVRSHRKGECRPDFGMGAALDVVEARCLGAMLLPEQELAAYMRWRLGFEQSSTSIGREAAAARDARQYSLEETIIDAARRLHQLAIAGGDTATAELLRLDLEDNAYYDSLPNTELVDGQWLGDWEFHAIHSPTNVRSSLVEALVKRKRGCSVLFWIQPPLVQKLYLKDAERQGFANLFTEALEDLLARERVDAITVRLLPTGEGSQTWVLCEKHPDLLSAGVLLEDCGQRFAATVHVVLRGPIGVDEQWLAVAEAYLSHRPMVSPAWITVVEGLVEQSAQALRPAFSPREESVRSRESI